MLTLQLQRRSVLAMALAVVLPAGPGTAALPVLLAAMAVGACVSKPVVGAYAAGGVDAPLAGRWRVSLQEADGVELDVLMTIHVTEGRGSRTWVGYSREGAARELVGAGTAFIGRLLGRMPARGALLHVSGGVMEGQRDTLRLEAVLESPFLGRRNFTGYVAGGEIRGEVTRPPSGAHAGTLTAVRYDSDAPLRNYVALAAELEHAIRSSIFNPAVADNAEFRHLFLELRRRFARARDDLDVIASFQALKRTLGTSHLQFIRNPKLAALPLDSIIAGTPRSEPGRWVQFGFTAPGVGLLRVTRWDRVGQDIDAAFARLDSAQASFLIIDIRGNPGGDATSIAPLLHLIRDTTPVGVFVGRQWYAAHSTQPQPTDFPAIHTLTSDATPMELLHGIRTHGAVLAMALPQPPLFSGTVFLLTDGRTGSASEPLAHALKITRRATLIGERTAGAMLMALPTHLGDGWVAVVPEADYFTADGTRLEGKGVEPDIRVSSNDVFLAVADEIVTAAPFSAELLRGGSYESMQRPRDAERAYWKAISVADAQQPAVTLRARAVVHKRLARLLGVRGDSARSLQQWREVLRLVPDDPDAHAALRGGS